MRLRPFLLTIGCIFRLFVVGVLAGPSSSAADESWGVPAWLRAHVGEGEDEIAPIVLQRARVLYLQKTREGAVRNSCYFAMDATRPNDMGGSGHRFYVICESSQSFRAIAAGHGGGRNLGGIANFANGRRLRQELRQCDGFGSDGRRRLCDQRDENVVQRLLPGLGTGGGFHTRVSPVRWRRRDCERQGTRVGGHAAVALKGLCLMKRPSSPYANQEGYVPRGTLVEYSGGRSDGCTSWTPSDARQIMSMVRDDPTTLYIYPDATDIRAAARGGSYWNASCLREIGSPRFWSRETLEPLLAEYKQNHPAPPPRPIPICKGP